MSRKPIMDEDKRKVLNMLEFCVELCPSLRICQIINNALPLEVEARLNGRDTYYISDKELAGYLREYADNLLLQSAERWKDEQEAG
jgi:DNA phosphorothioation-dependent restriction protein DptG